MTTSFRRYIQDALGVLLTKNWTKLRNENITNFEYEYFHELAEIYLEVFETDPGEQIKNYIEKFKNVSYILWYKDVLIGFLLIYMRPVITINGIKKNGTIYSFAVCKKFIGKGFGRKLLVHAISEMKLNDVHKLSLYVDENNSRAISLYKNVGFDIDHRLRNICGKDKACYRMSIILA